MAGAVLLVVAAPVYGIPSVHHAGRVIAGARVWFDRLRQHRCAARLLLPCARAAQAVGLMLFFPSFLLGAGGPPPHVMGSALRHVADVLPLTWVTKSIREPWLGIGTATPALIAVAVLAVVATYVAVRRTAL